MSNHSIFFDVDTLTFQILFIFFSLFVDNVKMINPWKFQPSTPCGSDVIKILKIWPKRVFWGKIHHFECMFSMYVITIVLVILSSLNLVWVRLLRWEIQKWHLEDLKNTCDQIDNWKKIVSSLSIDINLSSSQKWVMVLF